MIFLLSVRRLAKRFPEEELFMSDAVEKPKKKKL